MRPGTTITMLLLAVAPLGAAVSCKSRPAPAGGTSPEASAESTRGTTAEGGACRSGDDCATGLLCADDKTCQTPKTIDCRGRQDACLEEGRCLGRNDRCVPASSEACKKSRRCETDGRCTLKEDKCVAASPEDCKTLCANLGRCSIEDGTCVAATSKDCEDSEACKQAKRCRAYNGRCIGR